FIYTIYKNLYSYGDQNIEYNLTHTFNTNTSIYIPISEDKSKSYCLVLIWTSLFDNFYWHQQSYFNSSAVISCSSKYQCQFTRDKQRLSQASVVAFHLPDINRYQLPERKFSQNKKQNWVFVTRDSPINFYYQNPSFLPYILNEYFDRSISYRYDSPFSIFLPTIKSRLLLKKVQNLSGSSITEIEPELERNLIMKSLQLKIKPIVWIASHCITFSQREKYVEKLKEYIHIDVYGECGVPCSRTTTHQCNNINLHEYYFHLAFENSRCDLYITENFWNIMSDNTHRLVPIVMGANEYDYARIAPKKSYIHIDHYKTPEDLAKYLIFLMKNPEKYLEYLKWREYATIKFQFPGTWMNLLCPLCEMAYENHPSSYDRYNFSSIYHPKIQCNQDDVKLFKKCKQNNLGVLMSWMHNVKCP
ncbi:unnamed protein product, partial [Rotaria sp. Silwood2]